MKRFEENIKAIHGARGSAWLESLPSLLQQIEESWKISLKAPFPNLSYHYVAPGTNESGRAIVLKLGPDSSSLQREYRTLEAFHGQGCIEALSYDDERSALLLEGLKPGRPLSKLSDDIAASEIAARLMQKLQRPFVNESDFPKLEEWFESLSSELIPMEFVQKTQNILSELLQSEDRALMHGDLHHENILESAARWYAIDPKGVVGPQGYDVGPFLRNRVHHRRQAHALASVFAQELQIRLPDVLKWAYCDCVLSACWSREEGDPLWQKTLEKAEWFWT